MLDPSMHHNPLFDRLDKLKKTGPNRYQARCPAHEDRSPSLSLAIADDGRILCHCFAGCSAGDIMAAVGLELRDLFPNGPKADALRGATPWLRAKRIQTEEREEHHRLVLAAAESARGRGERLTPAQLREEREAWNASRKEKQ